MTSEVAIVRTPRKMSTAQLDPRPVRVSPLIKFGRWSFLTVGILWGIYHQNRLSKKEAILRENEAKLQAIRAVKIAEEKKRAAEAELKELERLAS